MAQNNEDILASLSTVSKARQWIGCLVLARDYHLIQFQDNEEEKSSSNSTNVICAIVSQVGKRGLAL